VARVTYREIVRPLATKVRLLPVTLAAVGLPAAAVLAQEQAPVTSAVSLGISLATALRMLAKASEVDVADMGVVVEASVVDTAVEEEEEEDMEIVVDLAVVSKGLAIPAVELAI